MIEIERLVKAFGILPVLRQLNLTVERGQFVSLLGPNGSGKSTLIRLLSGLSRPSSGTIRIGGWELPREAAAVRGQIGLVSHKPLLYENLTARENLAFFAQLYNIEAPDKKIGTLLERVGLARRADDVVRTFSRGMQQRLSIARALIHDPHVLLFDEPYTGLDQDASARLDTLLSEAHGEGHTIVMTVHQFDRVISLSSRVVILSRGSIAYDAPTAGLDIPSLAAQYTNVTGMTTQQ